MNSKPKCYFIKSKSKEMQGVEEFSYYGNLRITRNKHQIVKN